MRCRCLAVGWIPQAKPSTSFLSLLVDELVFSGKLIHPRALPPSGLAVQCSVAQVPWTGE